MANDSITPRTAITKFVESDPQNLDETVRITRQRTRDGSFNRSLRSVSSKHGQSKLGVKKSSKRLSLSMSSKPDDLTPKSTILGFIGSQDSEQTVRIQQRVASASRTPRSSRRKSKQGDLLRQATERTLRKNSSSVPAENPTPRTTISSIIGEGEDETPVVPNRHQHVDVIDEEPDISISGNQRSSFQVSSNRSDYESYLDFDAEFPPSQSSTSGSRRLRVQPASQAFVPTRVLEETLPSEDEEHMQSQLTNVDEDEDSEMRSKHARGPIIGSIRLVTNKELVSDKRSGIRGSQEEEEEIEEEEDLEQDEEVGEQEHEKGKRRQEENDRQQETEEADLEDLAVENQGQSPVSFDRQSQSDPEDVDMEILAQPLEEDSHDQDAEGEPQNDHPREHEGMEVGEDQGATPARNVQDSEDNIIAEPERSILNRNRRTSDRHWSQAILGLSSTTGNIEDMGDHADGEGKSSKSVLNKSGSSVVPESDAEDESDVHEGLPGFNSTFSKSRGLIQTTLDDFGKILTPILPKPSSMPDVPTPDVPPLKSTPKLSQRVTTKPIVKPKPVPPPTKRAKENVNRSTAKAKGRKELPRLPRSNTASIFRHFVDGRVSNEVIAEVEKVADEFWKQMAQDLGAYAAHANRATVDASDVELLMKRQRLVNERHTMVGFAEKYLPLDYQREIIQVPTSGNVLVPK